MRISFCVLGLLGLCCIGAGTSPTLAITAGVMDTFQDGTVMSWFGGTTITNVGGGQGGPLDQYLMVDSNGAGSGAGSKVSTHNSDSRWSGDYLAAGITGVQADMINLGPTTLRMRMVLFGLGSRFTSTNFVTLDPGGGWQHLVFPISSTDLTRVLGSGTYAASIADVNQLMFRHDGGTPSSGGEAINGTIGIDNVTAIPAPGAAALLVACGGWTMVRRRGANR